MMDVREHGDKPCRSHFLRKPVEELIRLLSEVHFDTVSHFYKCAHVILQALSKQIELVIESDVCTMPSAVLYLNLIAVLVFSSRVLSRLYCRTFEA